MRTTLDIEEDILFAAKEIARKKGITTGKALSDMARQAFIRQVRGGSRNGLPLFPIQPNAGIITMEFVNQLRDKTS
jgi:hypothetical protein